MLRNKKKPAADPGTGPRLRKQSLLVAGLWLASLILAVAATLWLTRSKPSFPVGYEANFVAACNPNGHPTSSCFCSLRYVEAHYTYKKALSEDAMYKKTGHVSSDLTTAFVDCNKHQ